MVNIVWRIIAVVQLIALVGVLCEKSGDWCEIEEEFCNGKSHIACQKNKFPRGECFDVQIVKMDELLVQAILDRHNYYRNEIACGRIGGYPTASKMPVMEWDEELEFLATQHVQHCNFQHDGCRASYQYPHAGQNLGFHATTGHLENLANVTQFMIDEWFQEYTLVDPSVVGKFEKSDLKAGHFTVVVNEANKRVGCGMITYTYKEDNRVWNAVMFTCDYAKTNILNWPIYTVGAPTTACKEIEMVPNKHYAGLCCAP
ncbi:antigen 5 like allergen Cul n 1-like [Lutzomyia longipalpis]|uniref:antigen 5 like allergen Cul n 1-like n=1 Tax=Lutzomyia longipalpis TaxID=7200 RepID=UPI002483AE05|nr:antigen 5 like allergen Cul n 1-like [Lutzomyia longipalpis]